MFLAARALGSQGNWGCACCTVRLCFALAKALPASATALARVRSVPRVPAFPALAPALLPAPASA
eukprot:4012252-Pleurochrysis_carterae.AAC.1